MPKSTLFKGMMAKRLREQEDKEMEDAQPAAEQARQGAHGRPSRRPAKALPLTSYIGPPQTRPSSPKKKPEADQQIIKGRKGKASISVRDAFFPNFPEPLCFELGCDDMAPHTHANGQNDGSNGLLPDAEFFRKDYDAIEVLEAREQLGKGLRARPRYALAASTLDFLPTNTTRPSQKSRDAATGRHHQKLTSELPVSKKLLAVTPAVSSPLKPPSLRYLGSLRRALPDLPKGLQQPRRKPTSQISAPRSNLAQSATEEASPYRGTAFLKPPRKKSVASQRPVVGAGSWVRALEDSEQLKRVVRDIGVIDLTGHE